MPLIKRPSSVSPRRPGSRSTSRDSNAQGRLLSRDPLVTRDDADMCKDSTKEPSSEPATMGGFNWSSLRLSLYRTIRIDEMKKKITEQEEEIQRLQDEKERDKAAIDKLQEALKRNRFTSNVHFGNVHYGQSNIYVVNQAKEVIEELSRMMTDALSNIAELKHTADRNEALLKEYMDTVNTYVSEMKISGTDLESQLEKVIAELSASHSDEHVFLEGIWALQHWERQHSPVTSFNNIPKKSRRAVQRLVRKYEAEFGVKRFANFFNMASVMTLQNVINGENPDQHVVLDLERCSKVVIEWTNNPDNTPKKFLDIVKSIDKLLVKEEAEKLVMEKTEALRKDLARKNQCDAVLNSSGGSRTHDSDKAQSPERKRGQLTTDQLMRDQMAHIAELCEYVLRLQSKVDEIQKSQDMAKEMTAQVKIVQEEMAVMLQNSLRT